MNKRISERIRSKKTIINHKIAKYPPVYIKINYLLKILTWNKHWRTISGL